MPRKKTVEPKQLTLKEIARKSPTFMELPEMVSRAGEPTYYYDARLMKSATVVYITVFLTIMDIGTKRGLTFVKQVLRRNLN